MHPLQPFQAHLPLLPVHNCVLRLQCLLHKAGGGGVRAVDGDGGGGEAEGGGGDGGGGGGGESAAVMVEQPHCCWFQPVPAVPWYEDWLACMPQLYRPRVP